MTDLPTPTIGTAIIEACRTASATSARARVPAPRPPRTDPAPHPDQDHPALGTPEIHATQRDRQSRRVVHSPRPAQAPQGTPNPVAPIKTDDPPAPAPHSAAWPAETSGPQTPSTPADQNHPAPGTPDFHVTEGDRRSRRVVHSPRPAQAPQGTPNPVIPLEAGNSPAPSHTPHLAADSARTSAPPATFRVPQALPAPTEQDHPALGTPDFHITQRVRQSPRVVHTAQAPEGGER